MANGVKFLSSLQTAVLDKDVLAADSSVVAKKGTTVILLPQTVAAAVVVEDGKTLAELWGTISKTDHGHEDYATALAGYQAELIRETERTQKAETRLAELEAWATSEHGYKPSP